MAPFIVAASRGLFGAEHLAVTFDHAGGSVEDEGVVLADE